MGIEQPIIYRLINGIRNYEWGDVNYLPQLLGIDNSKKEPMAEMWMGAHPSMPSTLITLENRQIPLNQWIAENPKEILGDFVASRFGELPYLFKVLCSASPLSIKVHPDKKRAEEGYFWENQAGIPLNDFKRNYKDSNHKPELLCAISEFWALRGFRYPKEIEDLIEKSGSLFLKEVGKVLTDQKLSPPDQLKSFFYSLVNMDKEIVKSFMEEILAATEPLNHPDQPVFYWIHQLANRYPHDTGALAPLYLNLFHLLPGEAFKLKAGVLHCYLKGTALEVMASSDNELRGGLTPKHVDLKELMKVVLFTSVNPEVLHPVSVGNEEIYETPFEEFFLSRLTVTDQTILPNPITPSILFCLKGKALLDTFEAKTGDTFFLPAQKSVISIQGEATFYRVSVPSFSTHFSEG